MKFRLEVSTWHSNGDPPNGVRVAVTDAASCEVLAEFDMDPGAWWMLIRGGVDNADGRTSQHLDRVGKKMVCDQYLTTIRAHSGDLAKLAEDEARIVHPGWEVYDAHATNQGWVVTMRRWDE